MPVLYEVNLDIDRNIAAEYRAWLHSHVQEMLTLPGFIAAQIWEQRESPADRLLLSVHYQLRDYASLENYLQRQAPRMRAEGQARFGGKFAATRRILTALDKQ